MGTMLLLWLPASPSLCRRRGGGLPLAGRPRVLDGEEGGGEHREGDVPVPAVVGAHLVIGQPAGGLGHRVATSNMRRSGLTQPLSQPWCRPAPASLCRPRPAWPPHQTSPRQL